MTSKWRHVRTVLLQNKVAFCWHSRSVSTNLFAWNSVEFMGLPKWYLGLSKLLEKKIFFNVWKKLFFNRFSRKKKRNARYRPHEDELVWKISTWYINKNGRRIRHLAPLYASQKYQRIKCIIIMYIWACFRRRIQK